MHNVTAEDINLDYRPVTYFRPVRLEQYLLSKVKGAVLRRRLKALFNEGRHGEVKDLLGGDGISAYDRKMLEAIHPRLMGGNYLPDATDGEIEIARIAIESTTCDVTSVYARSDGGAICYRVVDEYDGDTLCGPAELASREPLTLREFVAFFLGAWPLPEVVESNFEGDLEAGLEFFTASSDFYPDFGRLCALRVIEHYGDRAGCDDEQA